MEVDHCPDPGCYSRAINYNVTSIRQLAALAEMSAECRQSIQVYIILINDMIFKKINQIVICY
jgi:hypothetical protein